MYIYVYVRMHYTYIFDKNNVSLTMIFKAKPSAYAKKDVESYRVDCLLPKSPIGNTFLGKKI